MKIAWFGLFILLTLNNVLAANLSCDQDFSLNAINTIPEGKVKGNVKLLVDDKLKTKWHQQEGELRGIAIVTHAMNFRSDYMENIVEILNKDGIKALNVSLPGYREVKDSITDKLQEDRVTIEGMPGYMYLTTRYDRLKNHPERIPNLGRIHEHLVKAYCLAKKEADKHSVPVYFVGFSMGAISFVSLFTNPELEIELEVERMILLAPAFMSNFSRHAMGFVSKVAGNSEFGNFDKDYHFNKTQKFKAFRPVVDANNMLLENDIQEANIPTLVFVDPGDNIVGIDGLKKQINSNLTNWNLIEIKGDEARKHIVSREDIVGSEEWHRMKRLLLDFLQ